MSELDLTIEGLPEVLADIDELEERWTGRESWVVGTRVTYSVYLEFGTSDMDPKPFFRPVLHELDVRGVESFINAHGKIPFDAIDSSERLVQVLAFAIEDRVQEVILRKGLVRSGTLHASIKAFPINEMNRLLSEDDIAGSDIEVSV